MKELTIEHLAPYLPYGLQCEFVGLSGDTYRGELTSLSTKSEYESASFVSETAPLVESGLIHLEDIKPILRPLSMLTKEIKVNGEKFDPLYRLNSPFHLFIREDIEKGLGIFGLNRNHDMKAISLTHDDLFKLFEWHFDVFGLIDAGLAIEKTEDI